MQTKSQRASGKEILKNEIKGLHFTVISAFTLPWKRTAWKDDQNFTRDIT